MKCKPVSIADVVAGQFYLKVGVAMDGQMWAEMLVFYGQPIKDDIGWWIRTEKKKPVRRHFDVLTSKIFSGFHSVSDYGLDLNSRYNHYRVFKFTEDNRRILDGLVSKQDLVAYLTLIGVEDPIEAIIKDQERAREWDALDQKMDEMLDGFDPWMEDDFGRDQEEAYEHQFGLY